MSSDPEYDPDEALDYQAWRHGGELTAGAAALHPMDPAQIAMQAEEWDADSAEDAERWALSVEIFRGFLEYAFADGPDPRLVRARIAGFLDACGSDGRGATEWVSGRKIEQVLARRAKKLAAMHEAATSRGTLAAWWASLQAEEDAETVRRTLAAITGLLTTHGHGTWRKIVATAYALAKALRPELIAGMSLDEISTLSGDRGRATPQNRIKRIFRDAVEAAGHRGIHTHFQKSSSASEAARVAALGRRKKHPKPKTTRKPNTRQ